MADVLEDYSPIQINTSGEYQSKHFTVVGRIQLRYDDGFWNEWYVLFDDGTGAWLSDASGQYVFTLPQRSGSNVPKFEALKPGVGLTLIGLALRRLRCAYRAVPRRTRRAAVQGWPRLAGEGRGLSFGQPLRHAGLFRRRDAAALYRPVGGSPWSALSAAAIGNRYCADCREVSRQDGGAQLPQLRQRDQVSGRHGGQCRVSFVQCSGGLRGRQGRRPAKARAARARHHDAGIGRLSGRSTGSSTR